MNEGLEIAKPPGHSALLPLLSWGLLAGALIAAFAQNFAEMWIRWFPAWRHTSQGLYDRITGGESYYTHGPLIPFVSLLISVLIVRHLRIRVRPRPVWGGILLLLALLIRWLWRAVNTKPTGDDLSPLEQRVSYFVHWGFCVLLLVLMVSGYLISTPDGRPIDVFGWFSVPSIVQMHGLEDRAGLVHRWIAYAVIALAIVHALAAMKHHYVDKNRIMQRMWSGPPSRLNIPEKESHP